MAFDFKFPDVGEGIHEGKIVKWLVKEGNEVKADSALAEVETDKAVVEIPSPKSGKVLKIYHKEGEMIQVGEVLVSMEESGTASKGISDAAAVVGKLEVGGESVLKAPSLAQSGAVFATGTKPELPKVSSQPVVPAQPAVSAQPTAPAEPAVQSTTPVSSGIKISKKYDLFGYVDRVKYDGLRKIVGDHMVKSMFTIPHVTHTDLADVTKLFKIREREKKTAEKKGIKLTFLPFIIKAVVAGLKNHPYLNATLDEQNGDIILKKYFNIGVAVDTEYGLMVPVIKGADKKSILDIAKEITDLAEKARARKLNAMDMKGGTFTITNIGSTGGGWFATPVINYPEAAILATGMIQEMAVPKKGKVAIRKILPLSLAFDHRIFDGAEGARFINTIKEHLEDPDLFLLEGL
jgi:pyruvate dehydrogenase E2 component (dihydrolipoamide acetyltransferase)